MSNIALFYHLYAASDTPCHLTKEADADAQRTWLCAGCCSPKPGVTAVDAMLRVAPTNEHLNFVFGAGLAIASKAIRSALGDDLVNKELYLGRVYGPNGQELKDWATFRGKHRLIIRGSKNAQHRQCIVCGQTLYFAMGKNYLYPSPPSCVKLFESNLWGLVLTEDVFLCSGVEKFSGICVEKLAVASVPKDSLGEL